MHYLRILLLFVTIFLGGCGNSKGKTGLDISTTTTMPSTASMHISTTQNASPPATLTTETEQIINQTSEAREDLTEDTEIAATNVSVTIDPSASIGLIDPEIPLAIAGQAGWEYQRDAMADFDGDGVKERATLIAKVQLSNGQPLWDDNQPWQLYIEEHDGTRTYMYTRNVQLGHIEVQLTQATSGQKSTILLIENTPDLFSVYEFEYNGPNQFQTDQLLRRELNVADGFSGTSN